MELADLDLNNIYTYADYLKWQFDERVELIKGKIFKMSPAPNLIHQRLVSYINWAFADYLKGKKCEVFPAPFDVRFPRKTKDDKDIITVLQPDVCVVCDPAKLDDKGCIGAPDIVVEILSPTNNKKELKYKHEIYEEAGVKEYWVIMPYEKAIVVYTLVNGRLITTRPQFEEENVTTSILPGFALDITEMFKKV